MEKNRSKDINLIRVYDAPVKKVWDVWNDPKQAAIWWGPRGFTLTNHSKDLKVGGQWSYTMHGPDGTDFPNTTKYLEVDPYKRMVYDHGGNADKPPMFRVTVLFAENNGKTKMDMTMSLPTVEAAHSIRGHIKKAGGDTCWDRLGEYLAEQIEKKDVFFINRSFSVSLDTMFDLWTNKEHFSKWLPPTGFTMEYKNCDIKPGGKMTYKMTDGEHVTMYGRVEYREITKPSKLVYTQQFTDEKENISRHPFAPTWPETMLTNVTLSEEGPKQTRITVRWEPFGKATKEEIETFKQARAGMSQGWTGSFDKLEEYIEKNQF